jgi:hypothetical protein
MSAIVWDETGKRLYEAGVDHGVLYPQATGGTYPKGVAWNGLTAVNETPSGAEASPQYADNIKYLNLVSAEDFGASIEAFTYPDEFAVCDGSAEIIPGIVIGQQSRKQFGLSYRTVLGNDVDGVDYGYKLHLIYGALAAPSEKGYTTINDSPEAITFSWEVTTTPVPVTGFKPTASLVVNSTKFTKAQMKALEDVLYGTNGTESRLPLPDEVAEIMASVLLVKDSVRVVMTNEFDGVYDDATKTFTQDTATELVVDGITLALNDRVLLVGQINKTENGIYTVTTLGVTSGTEAVLTRATDMDESSELVSGIIIPVLVGTVNSGSNWKMTTASTLATLDTTDLNFQKMTA